MKSVFYPLHCVPHYSRSISDTPDSTCYVCKAHLYTDPVFHSNLSTTVDKTKELSKGIRDQIVDLHTDWNPLRDHQEEARQEVTIILKWKKHKMTIGGPQDGAQNYTGGA